MAAYRLSASAQADIIDILSWSHVRFGPVARQRYESLLVSALRDIASSPCRAGSMARPELGNHVRSWHIRLSIRSGTPDAARVKHPRHFLIYRPEDTRIAVGRVLHDAMELARHVPPDTWE